MASFTSDVKGLRTFEAIQLVKNGSVWIGVGKEQPWDAAETVPPVSYQSAMVETIGYKRSDQLTLVVPDSAGTIEQMNQNWRTVSIEEGKSLDARWVYVQGWLSYDEFALKTFRQTGVWAGLQPKDHVLPNQQVVYPADVVDPGYLLVLNNRSPITREANQKESIDFIIEF
ncbi:hypothetical protein EDM56_11965 [Brevibacillus fluminis]|uniref:Uncharacterized protein n=1 Tax=Brevibacillus fluminis TaxID=511487 RepID=A0A3M8DSC1_9BACL|nr:hypothetical protein [Brevibacillus fluminis]RNB89867.1 hypothetical protein EDM56_11965 [Brevibacillus fluminis]